jgi:hypothetical protein
MFRALCAGAASSGAGPYAIIQLRSEAPGLTSYDVAIVTADK